MSASSPFRLLAVLVTLAVGTGMLPTRASDPAPIAELLGKPVLGPRRTLVEVQEFVDAHASRGFTRPRPPTSGAEAERIRRAVLDRVVFRGPAAAWRDAKTRVERLGDAVRGRRATASQSCATRRCPGCGSPRSSTSPRTCRARCPVILAVNGHDAQRQGGRLQADPLHQPGEAGHARAERRVVRHGPARARPSYRHGCDEPDRPVRHQRAGPVLPVHDARACDVLLAHPNADPARVAVSGLSGGGWQTIFISALDTARHAGEPRGRATPASAPALPSTSRTWATRSRPRPTWRPWPTTPT